MMRFGPNSWARKVWYRKRKTQKCHLRFCGTVNKKGHSFRKGGALQVVKTEIRLWYFCGQTRNRRGKNHGDFHFGGPDRIRTDDPYNANQPPKLFSIISGHFWPFPLRSTSSLSLFDHAVSVWSEAVCGRFCGQKRSPALAGYFYRQGRGAFFMPLTACIVPLWTGLSKSFLCRPRLRN